MDPVSILPKEMWKCVIDQLDSHDDLLSAYNTCQLWRSLLSRNQAEWIFDGVFPSLMKYLSKIDILNCRHVCKKWNRGVDSHLETGQRSFIAPGCHFMTGCGKKPRTLKVNLNESAKRLNLSTTEVLKLFQTEFCSGEASTGKNPFVSRSLHLYIREINPTVSEFFDKFGAHLECLDLWIFQNERDSPLEVVKLIWKILKCVPNLKQLFLLTWCLNYMQIGWNENEALRLEVTEFWKSNSVPPLRHLNSLGFDGNAEIISQALKQEYAPQLLKYAHNTMARFMPSNLINLKELAWDFCINVPFCDLTKLKKLECPLLQRLDVYVRNSSYSADTHKHSQKKAKRLFKAIETFQSSLTHLYIYWTVLIPLFPKQLNLPLVQEVFLTIGFCPEPYTLKLSFLHSLKSLRKLKCAFAEVTYYEILELQKEQYDPGNIIDLHFYLSRKSEKCPYKSNIWQVLPSLDVIEIQVVDRFQTFTNSETKVYTRSEKEFKEMENV